jgi:hypothetical protein
LKTLLDVYVGLDEWSGQEKKRLVESSNPRSIGRNAKKPVYQPPRSSNRR